MPKELADYGQTISASGAETRECVTEIVYPNSRKAGSPTNQCPRSFKIVPGLACVSTCYDEGAHAWQLLQDRYGCRTEDNRFAARFRVG
jgi:hypothetical protein